MRHEPNLNTVSHGVRTMTFLSLSSEALHLGCDTDRF